MYWNLCEGNTLSKPRQEVLWIVDQPGWAYWQRSHTLAKLMPQYNHAFLNAVFDVEERAEEWERLSLACDDADAIICMSCGYEEQVLPWQEKVLLGLTGMRGLPDELAIGRDKPELELGPGDRGLDKQEQVSVCQDDARREESVPSPATATL